MGADAGADVIDDNVVDSGQLLHIGSGQIGILRAVSVHDADRDRFVRVISQGVAHPFCQDTDGLLTAAHRSVGSQGSFRSDGKEGL